METGETESLHDMNHEMVERALAVGGVKRHHAKALWRALQRDAAGDGCLHGEFSPPLAAWLEQHVGAGKKYFTDVLELVSETGSADGLTTKLLLRLRDGRVIETVLMGYGGRHTVCVSSQAGCAMGCVFCATGQMGFGRHLRAGEIVAQVAHASRVLKKREPHARVRNLVVMGMGEPLHNYDAVMAALGILSDTRGLGIGPSRMTVSTVGVVPGIARLAAEQRPYHLAVSLHGATEEERAALVPASRKWPLAMLMDACRDYGRSTGRRIFFEWTLIEGVNDSPDSAARLAAMLRGMDAHVNLIPLNPTGGYGGTPAARAAGMAFQRVLRESGLPCTFRQRRGIDVAAGCGQLAGAE